MTEQIVYHPDGAHAGEGGKNIFQPLLSSNEAASLLKVHPKTLQKMARDGRIPALRIGDLWRFRASDLDEWVKAQLSSYCHSCRN